MSSRRATFRSTEPAAARTPRPTLLLADSDRHTVNTLRRELEAEGYAVLTAESGPQALFLLYDRRPELLIMGTTLRGTPSAAVCEQVRSDENLGFVPVLLLAEPDWHDINADGVTDAVVFKPVDTDELLSWLRFLLRIKYRFDRLLHENRQLAEASRAIDMLKSDIITNVSHELRTPLVQVKAAVSLLAEDITQNGRYGQPHVAAMATQAVARLEGAVENIRQLAQSHDIRLGAVDVSEAIDLAIRFLERSWTSRNAQNRVEKQLEHRLPYVVGDKRALARLLQLLLDNALKFSPDDSAVHVAAYRVEDNQVWIGVQDFGIGIPSQEHGRIFEAFYQVDGSTTRRYGGTGTGLALAVLLASGMNTGVSLESEPGEGSTFSFLLPAADLDEFGSLG